MTYKTKILSLSSAAIVLALSFILGTYFSYRGSGDSSRLPLSSFFPRATVTEITLSAESGSITLARNQENPAGKGSSWSVIIGGESYPADSSKLDRLFEVIDSAFLSPPFTDKAENWERFELEEEAPRRIGFSGKAGKAEIILGKGSGQGKGEYVRFSGKNEVYLLSESLSYYSGRNAAYWSYLRLFPENLSGRDVSAISLEKPAKNAYTIFRDGKNAILWAAPDKDTRKPDQGKAETLAATLAQLNARSFAAGVDPSRAGLDAPFLSISFTDSLGSSRKLLLGNEETEKNRYCAVQEDGGSLSRVYILDSYNVERIEKPPFAEP